MIFKTQHDKDIAIADQVSVVNAATDENKELAQKELTEIENAEVSTEAK